MLKSLFDFFSWRRNEPPMEPPMELELPMAPMEMLKRILNLKSRGVEVFDDGYDEDVEKTLDVLKRYPEIMIFIVVFLSTKTSISSGKGHVVYPVVKEGLFCLEGASGNMSVVSVDWQTESLPRFSASLPGLSFKRKLLSNLSEVELQLLSDVVSDRGLTPGYIGPGDVLDFEELIGSEEERAIAKRIQKLLDRRRKSLQYWRSF